MAGIDTLISAGLEGDGVIAFHLKSDSDRPLAVRVTFDDAFALASLALLKLSEAGSRHDPARFPVLATTRWKVEPIPDTPQMMFSYTLQDGARVGHLIHRDQAPDMMLAIAISAGLPIPSVPDVEQN